jgi:hypothetical protein
MAALAEYWGLLALELMEEISSMVKICTHFLFAVHG